MISQLHRIGAIAMVSVVAAAALGTFSLLHRIVAPVAAAPAPHTVGVTGTSTTMPGSGAAISTPRAATATPSQVSSDKALRSLSHFQQQQVKAARRQNAAVKQGLSRLAQQARALRKASQPATPIAERGSTAGGTQTHGGATSEPGSSSSGGGSLTGK
jgi:hypothetical protein